MGTVVGEITGTPRPPLTYNQKSGSIDRGGDGYKAAALRWRESARDEAMSNLRMNPEYDRIQMYTSWIEGQGAWTASRPDYRSRFFDNRIAEARTENLSMLTDIRPVIDVSSKIQAYEHHGEIVKNVIAAEWRRLNLDLELVRVIDHALFSVGYWKMGAFMPGYMVVTPCGMDCVLPIQPGLDIQEAAAILYRSYKPIQYFKHNWGAKAANIERYATRYQVQGGSNNEYARPGFINEYTWNNMSPQMRYRKGLRQNTRTQSGQMAFPVVELEEYWIEDWSYNDSPNDVIVRDPDKPLSAHNYHYRVPPGGRLFPRKRLMVFAGDEIMYDGPSPYWHGRYPFAKLELDPVVWAPGGLSKYRNLIPLNKLINEIGAGTADVVRKAVNPPMITKDNAVRDAAWQKFFPDLPGGKLKLSPMASVQADVRWMDPPILPPYVFQMLAQYLIPTFDRRSGILDAGQLGSKKQVPGGDSVEQMRDTMQASFRLQGRYIEPFLRDAGIQAISNVFQFFTGQQRMRMLGPDGITWEDFDYDPDNMVPWSQPNEDHWKLFAFDIAQGSLHSGSKDRDKQIAIMLFRTGAISRKQLLRTLDIGNIDEIEAEIAEEHSQMAQIAAGAGQPGAPSPGRIANPLATQGQGRTPRLTRGARTGSVV